MRTPDLPQGWMIVDDDDRSPLVIEPAHGTTGIAVGRFADLDEVGIVHDRSNPLTVRVDSRLNVRAVVHIGDSARQLNLEFASDGGSAPGNIVIDGTSRKGATPLKVLVGSEPDQRVALELANATVDIESKASPVTLTVTATSSIAASSGTEVHASADTTIRQHAGDVPLIATTGDVMLVLSRNVNVSELRMAGPGRVTVVADSSASSAQAVKIAKVTGSAAGTFVAGRNARAIVGAVESGTTIGSEDSGFIEIREASVEGLHLANAHVDGIKSQILDATGSISTCNFTDSVVKGREGARLLLTDTKPHALPGPARTANLKGATLLNVAVPVTTEAVPMIEELKTAYRFTPAIDVQSYAKIRATHRDDPDGALRESTVLAILLDTAEAKHGEPAALADIRFKIYQLRRFGTRDRGERYALWLLRLFGYGQRWPFPLALWWLLAIVGAIVHQGSQFGWRPTLAAGTIGRWWIAFGGTLFAPVGLLRPIEGWFPPGGWGIVYGIILAVTAVAFGSTLIAFRRLTRFE